MLWRAPYHKLSQTDDSSGLVEGGILAKFGGGPTTEGGQDTQDTGHACARTHHQDTLRTIGHT